MFATINIIAASIIMLATVVGTGIRCLVGPRPPAMGIVVGLSSVVAIPVLLTPLLMLSGHDFAASVSWLTASLGVVASSNVHLRAWTATAHMADAGEAVITRSRGYQVKPLDLEDELSLEDLDRLDRRVERAVRPLRRMLPRVIEDEDTHAEPST